MGSALPEPLVHAASPPAGAALEPLRQTLRALWDLDALALTDAEQPHLVGRTIRLPRHAPPGQEAEAWRLAAAAHAAAHLVYSPSGLDGRGLKPIARAIVGVLEDARVENLAGRELPGLHRWWRARHTVTPLDGDGVEMLLLRLARALADPRYEDPHPWVRKGRSLFFLDANGTVLAEPRAERLRGIASRLGHDLGQMRLQFNAKGYRPGPDYRDDHRWMWPAPSSDAPQEQPSPPPPGRTPPATEHDDSVVRHPEWDRLIARLRPAWCRVAEWRAQARTVDAPQSLPVATPAAWRCALLGARASGRWQLHQQGPQLDLDALLRLRVARRCRRPGDERVHRGRARDRRTGSVLLLIDQSASTSAAWGDTGMSQLQAASEMAWQAAHALAGVGLAVSIAAFSSNGRHAVDWREVLAFGEPLDAASHARLSALRSAGSTRLGAALRHAARRLARRRDGERIVLVFSDADPYDIDVHDPRYLLDDARHAARRALRQGLRLACLAPSPAHAAAARRIFGPRHVSALGSDAGLPQALKRLLD
ncbi:VWA domain-containing protein [uncultured Piscinibacter sp.]|uniref:VWA domain-containing protein n=1 Tax=uncultured Piscinibacter sp. TaxID=1131835 RepID=UPI0026039F29|nr:VWA domain-containing protein [uncultured Piscinibacter sp.]